jgi:hypothetical protein
MSVALNEVSGSVLIYLTAVIASAAGVGGDVINVGIFLVVWNFAFSQCFILSLSTLLGNFIAQVRQQASVRRRH